MSEHDEWQRLIETKKIAEYWIERCSRAEKQLEQRNWVSVKDRLPEEDGHYLVVAVIRGKTETWRCRLVLPYSKFFKKFSAFKPVKFAERYEIQKVTHWLELPPMPKEDEDGIN